jgi:hypothetical protein
MLIKYTLSVFCHHLCFPQLSRIAPEPDLARKAVLRGHGSALVTDGNGGPVTCQWVRDDENLPTGTVIAASGQQQVRDGLKWNLRGTGTRHAAAIFQFFTPGVIFSPVRLLYL